MASPEDLQYTKSHEWVRVEGDLATVGLADYAQNELGDITYLELPEVGDSIVAGEPLGVVESVKAASDIYAPLGGEVVERNETAIGSPELVNQSPYGDAWLIKVRLADQAELDALMDVAAYETFLETEAGH
ncbi:MAG: glycine cleavage system protein GcvH [Thermomicrobiales bacterium]|nr:glycine cleavage system protein GcvH [Thermomicrobiales bacterium]MCO5223567.1 glycine cleavage system protein GcvH [Thermomicrobiales bacterium]